MNSVEKIINTFSYGGLILTAAALVVSIICFTLFLRSRTDLSTKEEILADEMDEHRKKRKSFIAFLIIFGVAGVLTAGAFLVKSATSSFSYLFFPIYSTTVSRGVLTVSPLIEYETQITATPNVITQSATLTEGQTVEFSFTAKANGNYLLSFTDMSEELKLDVTVRDKNGEEIYAEADMRDYDVSVVERTEKGNRYTVTITASKGSGRFELEIIEPKNFDIKHYTAVKDSLKYTNQSNTYYYTAPWDGVYSFYLTDVDYRCNISIKVPDSAEIIYEDGKTATVKLLGGKTYIINVNQEKGYCGYTLNVMRQKYNIDISNINEVNDTFEFYGQRNGYSLSGRTEIELNFETGEIGASVFLTDEEGNLIYDAVAVSGSQRVAFPNLDKRKTYVIVVASKDNEGEYKFYVEQ